jgi:uncharacterized Rmd1/YagE family protein
MPIVSLPTDKKQTKAPSFNVEVAYVGEWIDLKRVQENIKQYSFLNREHPIVLKLLDKQYAVLTKFGAVTFWNVGEKLKKQFLSEVALYSRNRNEFFPHSEKTKVVTGADIEHVTFNKVFLTDINVEKIRIVSYVLSQSVALERYENEIEVNLNEVSTIIENLKSKGKALMREKDLLKQIGRVLSVKQATVAHLSLFDKPDEAWESPELESLYNQLHKEYEMSDRFEVLNQKMDFLSDNAKMLMDFISEKKNALLELIIIALIVIEMIPLLIDLIKYIRK